MKFFVTIFVLAVVNAQPKTTVDTLAGDSRFSTLVSLVTKAGLVSTLNSGNYTIFAPTNAAFSALPAATLSALQSDTTLLSDALLYHVAAGVVPSSAVSNDIKITMANGKDARVNVYSHNNKVTIDGCVISQFDLVATNGIIHVLDSVMVAPTTDIVGYVSGNSKLSTLLSLVQQAGLASALQKDGLTLFAPTNAAFSMLPQDLVTSITSDPAKLASVLTYHVVNGTQYSVGLFQRERVPTLNPKDKLIVHMLHHHSNIKVDNGLVTAANIGVTNGVIHLINHVLIPHQDPIVG